MIFFSRRLVKREQFAGRVKDRGAIFPFIAMAILPTLMVLALAFDAFLIFSSRTSQTTNAQYAAQAALISFIRNAADPVNRRNNAVAAATAVVARNSRLGEPGRDMIQGLVFGRVDGGLFTTDVDDARVYAVQVTLQNSGSIGIILFFSKLLGGSIQQFQSTGIAYDCSLVPPDDPVLNLCPPDTQPVTRFLNTL